MQDVEMYNYKYKGVSLISFDEYTNNDFYDHNIIYLRIIYDCEYILNCLKY